jgi:hypothetical protein
MTYPPVLSKRDFVKRFREGEFGNASLTWDSLEDFEKSRGYWNSAFFHIRNRVAGGSTHYNILYTALPQKWAELKDPDQWYISAMAPHDKTLIQGEVMETEKGLSLYYSDVNYKPMREALAEKATTVSGIISISLLRHYLCPNSYDWLMELIRRYPSHVIEFSTFSCKWGTLYPLFNTVFWEVRLY